MKAKGFTLAELLGIIMLIAAIALITTPIIIGTLDKSKKSIFEKSVNGIMDTIRVDNAKRGYNETNYIVKDGKITSVEGENVKKSGGSNENGVIYIDKDGDISLAIEKKTQKLHI